MPGENIPQRHRMLEICVHCGFSSIYLAFPQEKINVSLTIVDNGKVETSKGTSYS